MADDDSSILSYQGNGTTEGSSGNTTSSSSEDGSRRRTIVTMDGVGPGIVPAKRAKMMNSDAERIIETGKEFARSELFDAAVFYPSKDMWNMTERFGRFIVKKCNLPVNWQNPTSVYYWKKWWQDYKAVKHLREAHTRRRRTVVERIKTTFVGKCGVVVISFAGEATSLLTKRFWSAQVCFGNRIHHTMKSGWIWLQV